ncbi:MAG TPA: ABC transporter ATP-binding protein [Acidimicrobiales bacterium]|nr:ABC transporter ATP-binding protein [Acidimicrobiales bacterium]
MAETTPVLEGRGLSKTYQVGTITQTVLDGIDLTVSPGAFLAVMGPSGSGKSTLLHLLGGLDRPDGGEVLLDGKALSAMSDDERTLLRRRAVGIVYQFFNLVPVLTVEENVCLPAVIAGEKERAYRQRLDTVLELVGLAAHRDKQPAQLSGGQQQRAAIARALFVEPRVLLADEPTGNLDFNTGAEILHLFSEAQRLLGQTIVMVTHDPRGAGWADEVLLLRDGRIGGRLDLRQKLRAQAAKLDRSHPSRAKAVLRWLEQLDSGDAATVIDVREPAASKRRTVKAPA